MSYIRIERFWDFQNADAWKKAAQAKKDHSRHPNWCKLVVRRDLDMDKLPISTRLLYFELLRLATEYANVIPGESEWIAKRISMRSQDVVKGVELLRKGRWIKETATKRTTRNESERKRSESERNLKQPRTRSETTPNAPQTRTNSDKPDSELSRELLETFATRTRTRTRTNNPPSFLPTSVVDAEGQEGTENGKHQLPDLNAILKEMPA